MLRPRIRRAFRLAIRRDEWTDADVDEELRLHVELRVEQLVRSGWTRSDAEAEARRRFGPSWNDAVRHLHRSGRAREERLAMRERLDSIWRDVRHSARALRRSPRFTIAAVVTLALGLGFTTVIVSLVDHIVLRPLPYAGVERLVVLRESFGGPTPYPYPSMPANASHFLEWQRHCTVCEGMGMIKRAWYTVTGDGDPQHIGAVRVTANLLPLLGVRPVLGRAFRADEEQEGRDGAVMISDAFWRGQYGGDPKVIGRTIILNDVATEIVGVLPPGFSLPGGDELGQLSGLPNPIDVYRPLALKQRERITSGEFDYVALARLRPGATPEQVRAQLDPVEAEFAARDGGATTLASEVIPMQKEVVGGAGRPLLLLLAAVGAVLLIVCVNLANLMLVRDGAREHESAIRVALGAGRARLARMALAESFVVALAGGALGLLLAHWGLRALIALAPANLPRVSEVRLDFRVIAIGAVLTVIVAVVVGALPAARAGGTAPSDALRAGGRTSTNSRGAARRRALFIGVQVAFSTVLLVGAGLFLASFVRVMRVERGFDTDRVLAVDVALPSRSYPSDTSRSRAYERLLAEVAGMPGVTGVAVASALPLEGETWVNGVWREEDVGTAREHPTANYRFVSPNYFKVIGTPLRTGRVFDESDHTHQVVVLSERAAQALWPNENPIGKRVRAGGDCCSEVIGVAAEVRTSTLEKEGSLVVYLPLWEYPPTSGAIVVRTKGEPGVVTTAVRSAIRRVDASIAVPRVRTMGEVVSNTVAARRFQLGLLALFALLALVTASVGIYGVIAQSLASRTREIGVRMALGARPWDVHRLVLREGLTPVAFGLVAGVAASVVAGKGIQSLLFEVQPGDPGTILGVGLVLAIVAVIACVIPARRVTTAGVTTLLRTE
ncbi:MAG TPA: ABC transporter permease [Gemmatimonadaceae bacterium]|nr:ABC transporter permease [Gemmatimonadaceae bacterium]